MRIILILLTLIVFSSCGESDLEFPSTFTFSEESIKVKQFFVVNEDQTMSSINEQGTYLEITSLYEGKLHDLLDEQGGYNLELIEFISDSQFRIKGKVDDNPFDETTSYSIDSNNQIIFDDILEDLNLPLFYYNSEKTVEACYSFNAVMTPWVPGSPVFVDYRNFPCEEANIHNILTQQITEQQYMSNDSIGIYFFSFVYR